MEICRYKMLVTEGFEFFPENFRKFLEIQSLYEDVSLYIKKKNFVH